MNEDEKPGTEKLTAFLEDIQGGIILCNYTPETMTAETVYVNKGWTDITGYTIEQLVAEKGGNPQALVLNEDKKITDEKYRGQLFQNSAYELMYRIVHRSGKVCWVLNKGVTTTLPDGRLQNKSIVTEITQIKEQEEYMTLLAQTDQLTALNNKTTFNLLAQADLNRKRENRGALLMIDIDRFKNINDTYGHDFGDKVLVTVAQRMKSSFRSGDILGRVGGDEFMVLMTEVANEQAVEKKTREFCAAINDIKIPEHKHMLITISVGISFFWGGKPFETVFAEADTALYNAKSQGKNRYCVWRGQEKPNLD